MKKIIIYSFLFVLLLSCDDILNVQPKSVVTTANMWENENDAKGAMFGMYRQLRSTLNEEIWLWGDFRTGFYDRGQAIRNPELFENRVNPSSDGSDWGDLYTMINDANLILKYVPDIEFTNETEKNKILANAYYIRALSYFYIARVWGDAPLPLDGFESAEQEGLFPNREPVSEILNQVQNDLELALDLIPSDEGDILFASRSAINMLKADYHLWMAKVHNGGQEHLNSANAAVNDVISNDFELLDDYESVFRNKENNEIIFSIRFERDDGPANAMVDDGLWAVQFIPDSLEFNPIPVGGHSHWYSITEAHEAFLYENPQDSRAAVTYASYDNVGGEIIKWINKYVGDYESGTAFSNADIFLYRYAEALLFKAEIENALGNQSEALKYLNMVAERAYGESDFYTGAFSKQELDSIILDERLKEFATEGKAWFDLVRFDQVFERVWSLQGRENEQNILLWPISFTSLNRNTNLEQTPGY